MYTIKYDFKGVSYMLELQKQAVIDVLNKGNYDFTLNEEHGVQSLTIVLPQDGDEVFHAFVMCILVQSVRNNH